MKSTRDIADLMKVAGLSSSTILSSLGGVSFILAFNFIPPAMSTHDFVVIMRNALELYRKSPESRDNVYSA